MSPSGTSAPVSSPTSACRRRARTAPRVWIPTSAKPSGPGFFSTISWAIRTSVRRRSSRSSTTVSLTLAPSWPRGTGLKEPTRRRVAGVAAWEARRDGRRESAIAAHEAAGRHFEAGGVRSFVREEGDGRGGRAPARRPEQLLPLPQGAAGAVEPGAARSRLRLPRPRAGRAAGGLRLLVVGPGALDRGGDRRARDRALPPRRPRHRRADRVRVGDPQSRIVSPR